jgi:NAD(P)-dependent dehydrogenase (short-subunit alcohol dehydrogenase family)
VLVTGGAGGIGRAIVAALVASDACVVAADRAAASEVRGLFAGAPDHLFGYIEADVSSPSGARAGVDAVVERFGRIDVLVNNAAVGRRARTPEVTEQQWDEVLNTNLKGAFFVAQRAADHMLRRGGGKIINVASELAHSGHPGAMTYAAAKAALLNLTRSLALDLAPGVLVNAVCPGPTDTAMLRSGPDDLGDLARAMPIGRLLTPEDIARTVVFLVGPGGDAYTGQHLDPNGGAVMA